MDSMLSQEEINALLNGIENGSSEINNLVMLTDEEKDAIGEISNISMGTAATTLSTLLNNKVIITAPDVGYTSWEEISASYARPCVLIEISYKQGLTGNNILVLEENDVKVISDLMMGGEGKDVANIELSEMHLSAISEAMNQMMGSAATSLSALLDKKIDISPPSARVIDINSDVDPSSVDDFLNDTFVKVSFRLEIEGIIDSQIMQLYPMSFAKELYAKFIADRDQGEISNNSEVRTMDEPKRESQSRTDDNSFRRSVDAQPDMASQPMGVQMNPQMGMPQMSPQMNPQMGIPQMNQQMGYQQPMQYQMPPMQPMNNVNVQPAQFAAFSGMVNPALQNENIDLIMDVPLEVTVELGRTNKSIKEILEFKPGTIVELNKIAGEPIDILVNGKFVAKGEVVVIDESFGIRITEITK